MHLKTATWVMKIVAAFQLLLLLNVVNCSINPSSSTTLKTSPDGEILAKNEANNNNPTIIADANKFPSSKTNTSPPHELGNVLQLLPTSIRESIRSYIASRMKRVILLTPSQVDAKSGQDLPQNTFDENGNIANLTFDLTTLSTSTKRLYNPYGKRILGSVPIVPANVPTPKWVPGELIATQISKREIQLLNQSMFGPLKSVTMFPTLGSSIIVFNRRYNPERLAQILKYNYGIEAEPNGVIVEM